MWMCLPKGKEAINTTTTTTSVVAGKGYLVMRYFHIVPDLFPKAIYMVVYSIDQ